MLISEHSERESAKQRARRIPLDYHRQRTPLEKAKWRLSWFVGIAALAYAAYVVVGGQGLGWAKANRAMSPGPVASVHQSWNDQCEQCHEPGQTLREDSRGMKWLNGLLGREQSPHHSANTSLVSTPSEIDRCERCHSGSLHHPRQLLGESDTCANCHRDHQGSSFDLRRMADSHCLKCHQEIETHRRGDADLLPTPPGSVDITAGIAPASISSLDKHPTSRSLKEGDPSKLKFNHRLHQLPGQYAADAKAGAAKTLASIDRSFWTRLGYDLNSDPATVVQLNCAVCHESDEVESKTASGNLAVPASGAYMLPIDYERHCGMCHDQDLVVSIPKEQGVVSGRVAHGLKATEVTRLVWGLTVATDDQLSQINSALRPPRAIPGQNEDSLATARADTVLASRVNQVLGKLQEQQCGKCHQYPAAGGNGGESEATAAGDQKPAGESTKARASVALSEILPTSIPSVWYKVARFDHAAHRAVNCAECHAPEAFTWPADKSGKPPLDEPTPIIPDIDNCRRCHGAKGEQAARASGDCVECHDYHSAYLSPGERAKARHALPLLQRRQGGDWMGNPDGKLPAATKPDSKSASTPTTTTRS